jgi:hypothetical protein
VAVVGWLVRVIPLIVHGPLGTSIDYDEGVHYAAAALVARGYALYRDFAFMHPPAMAYLLAPFTALGSPSTGFGLARVVMTVVGAVNIFLVGVIASRYVARPAAVGAAAIYAFYPEVVSVERGVYLEPVLNLFCLAAALVWLSSDLGESDRRGDRRAWVTGVLLGIAIAVKLWGGFALIACLAAARPVRWRRDVWRVIAGTGATTAVLVLPAALRAPGRFFDDVVLFQLRRVPDGYLSTRERLRYILFDPHGASALVHSRALVGTVVVGTAALAILLGRRRSRMLTFAAVWYLLIAGSFLLSPAYWEMYNAHLAPAVALLGAGAIDYLVVGARGREKSSRRLVYAAGLVALILAFVSGVVIVADDARLRDPDLATIGAAVRQRAGGCVFSFEPEWLLAGDRLPDPSQAGQAAVDPYGAQLEAVVEAGRSYPDLASALNDGASQAVILRAVDHCPVVLLGLRGQVQLGKALPEFTRAYERVTTTSPLGPDLWIRKASRATTP